MLHPFRLTLAAVVFALLAPLVPAGAGAQQAEPGEGAARIEVLPGPVRAGRRYVALHLSLAPGWKTYWRAPGDAGIPPRLDLSPSRNLTAAAPLWPVPHVFTLNGTTSIGYTGELVLPLAVTSADPGRPLRLAGSYDGGICDEVCVPLHLGFDATLPPDAPADPRVAAALDRQPLGAAAAGLRSATCAVSPIGDGLRLTATFGLPASGSAETVAIEPGDPTIWASTATATRHGDTLTAVADLVPPQAQPFALDRSSLRFTVIAGGRAVDIRGCSAG